jgi:D-alanine-D-alanine ligase
MKKTRVIVLFGGRSAEHEISLLSARNVLAALDRERFEPSLIGIDRAGRWHRESERTLVAATGDPRALGLDQAAPIVGIEEGLAAVPQAVIAEGDVSDVVVFPVLHGTFGEDGTVQGLLELGDVAYVGSGVLGSAVGMDKDVAKRLLRDAGIPVVDFAVVTASAFARDPQTALAAAPSLGYPLFVKPVNAGSSVGVSRVAGSAGLEPAIRAALAFDRKVLLERAVDAREIECAVLGNDDPVASIPGEVLVHHPDGFYSYDAKYVDPDGASWKIPAELPPRVTARVQTLAVATFRALELAGMARVDFFLSRDDGALYVNEVNTIPGFTAVSMYPKMWEASGLSQKELLSSLIDLALERRDARRALRTGVGPRRT